VNEAELLVDGGKTIRLKNEHVDGTEKLIRLGWMGFFE